MNYDRLSIEQLDELLLQNMQQRAELRQQALEITAARDRRIEKLSDSSQVTQPTAPAQAIRNAGNIESGEVVKGM